MTVRRGSPRHPAAAALAARRRRHLKAWGGLGANDDVAIGPTGDVYNAQTGEYLGSLTVADEKATLPGVKGPVGLGMDGTLADCFTVVQERFRTWMAGGRAMTRDVTAHFETAAQLGIGFHDEGILSRLQAAAARFDAAIDFSPGSGEEWLRILTGRIVHGYLWTHGPLAIGDQLTAKVVSESGLADALLIEVSDMDNQELSVRPEALEAIMPGFHWPEEIDATRLSAKDLWWSTV